jgi:hypothetical protein
MSYSHIYIDESGEFGIGPNSSETLIITALMTNTPRHIEKIAKKLWRALPHLHVHQELHANESDDRSIRKTLTELASSDAVFHAYTLRKHPSMHIHQEYYRMIASVIRNNTNAYAIYVDKRDTNKKRRAILDLIPDSHIFDRVEFVDSRAVKQIQMVDFVSWAIFQEQEFGINSYTDIIKDKIHLSQWPSRQD